MIEVLIPTVSCWRWRSLVTLLVLSYHHQLSQVGTNQGNVSLDNGRHRISNLVHSTWWDVEFGGFESAKVAYFR
ncbi:hypothetical protein F5B19DRAFT_447906 [Rostrohypoxylon terebratum]|nr:hypothetical protein F5B19DRAFT_447906 [Rostrohypoxylon terebratum]